MNDTEREQLELAAKAAGYWNTEFNCYEGPLNWNPRNDDGDAFRLMVALNFSIVLDEGCQICVGRYDFDEDVIEYNAPDPIAATREAIFRAAVEIGRNMK